MKNNWIAPIAALMLIGCRHTSPQKMEEVVVIGGGLMGSAAAWHLSNKNTSLILLEKQDSLYTEGSSLGQARIARSNNRSADLWSYLHNRSVSEVQVLIEYLNSTGSEDTFRMNDIYTTSPVTYVGRISILDQLMSSLKRQKVAYEIAANPIEAREIFDVYLPHDVLIQREYNLHSGTINPENLISLLHKAIRKKGNRIQYNMKVTNIQYDQRNQIYRISYIDEKNKTAHEITSKKVVAAVGPYTGTLLSEIAPYMDELITPKRVFLVYLKIKNEVYDRLSDKNKRKLKEFYPVINSASGTREGSFFSMIEYYDENNYPVIKIGGHFQRSDIVDLDSIWSAEITPREVEWSKSNTHGYLQLLRIPLDYNDLEVVKGYSCVYSLTESEVPLVAPLVTEDMEAINNFIVMGGMSGVGAKGAMTYGLIAANLLTGEDEPDTSYQNAVSALGLNRLITDLSD